MKKLHIDERRYSCMYNRCVLARGASNRHAIVIVFAWLSLFKSWEKAVLHALDNKLALTPPMGFNSWEWFRCDTNCSPGNAHNCMSETLFREIADAMVDNGMQAAGYVYVNIDDCWALPERDAVTHRLVADPERFPGGIPRLARFVHARGLKLGLYGDAGSRTSAGFPGSRGYEELDAETFLEWGVDYIKMDAANLRGNEIYESFARFGAALDKAARKKYIPPKIVYSCVAYHFLRDGGTNQHLGLDIAGLREHCNLWRNCEDIGRHIDAASGRWYWDRPTWRQSIRPVIDHFLRQNSHMLPHHGPGGWNDPDVMSIGTPQMSQLAYARTQFALWSILAAPLLVSSDLRSISHEPLQILLNRDIIAINQDKLGLMAYATYLDTDIEDDGETGLVLLVKPILPAVYYDNEPQPRYHSYAFMVINFNTGTVPQKFNVQLKDLGSEYFVNPKGYDVTELYTRQRYGIIRPDDVLSFRVAPNDDCVIFRATAQQ